MQTDPAPLLALIADLYAQLAAARDRIEQLEASVAPVAPPGKNEQ